MYGPVLPGGVARLEPHDIDLVLKLLPRCGQKLNLSVPSEDIMQGFVNVGNFQFHFSGSVHTLTLTNPAFQKHIGNFQQEDLQPRITGISVNPALSDITGFAEWNFFTPGSAITAGPMPVDEDVPLAARSFTGDASPHLTPASLPKLVSVPRGSQSPKAEAKTRPASTPDSIPAGKRGKGMAGTGSGETDAWENEWWPENEAGAAEVDFSKAPPKWPAGQNVTSSPQYPDGLNAA